MQVTEETENLRFNTGISAMMEFVNAAFKWEAVPKAALEPFVLLLAPYAPHLAEELWQVSSSGMATCNFIMGTTSFIYDWHVMQYSHNFSDAGPWAHRHTHV